MRRHLLWATALTVGLGFSSVSLPAMAIDNSRNHQINTPEGSVSVGKYLPGSNYQQESAIGSPTIEEPSTPVPLTPTLEADNATPEEKVVTPEAQLVQTVEEPVKVAPTLEKPATTEQTETKLPVEITDKQPASPVIKAEAARSRVIPFWDLAANNYFIPEISWAKSQKITTGWGDGTFRPDSLLNRKDVAAFLYRLAGSPRTSVPKNQQFVDVPVNSQFSKEISWLASKHITTGWADGTFRPHTPITREALAAFLYRFCSLESAKNCSAEVIGRLSAENHSSFKDVPRSNPFHREIAWMASSAISTGWPDGTFRPHNLLDRQTMLAFTFRVMHNQSHQNLVKYPRIVGTKNPYVNNAQLKQLGSIQPKASYRGNDATWWYQHGQVIRRGGQTYAIYGPIYHYWTNGGQKLLGWPRGNAYGVKKNGVAQWFEHGGAYQNGAKAYGLTGRILAKWAAQGYENGPLGLPVGQRERHGNTWRQHFQGGYLYETDQVLTMNVPWVGQYYNYYCGAAAGEMVLRHLGAYRSALTGEKLSQHALAGNTYMKTRRVGFTSFHNKALAKGINTWLGNPNAYRQIHVPTAVKQQGFNRTVAQIRQIIKDSFANGYPVVVDEQEARGGYHPNGHNNATFSHIMVVTGYNPQTDAFRLQDPGAGMWSRAAKSFWYPSLSQFVKRHLSREIERDGRRHIGIYHH
ncbi:hypothetical protein BK816_06135 [Boudabousia tangfeifanii]|uniref:SLH domain-containing protein n=1 Tax=Boudabousia tangfeifanii TaxID=1912795 RepID=A0A1D9ML77_9ACTO|nr:S-layer homology domain-containing protein [Boudabousia tangfeifanii]AOZ72923.1 hypothetical protein BK816_06135 [Boudabousia tangfeifanii]